MEPKSVRALASRAYSIAFAEIVKMLVAAVVGAAYIALGISNDQIRRYLGSARRHCDRLCCVAAVREAFDQQGKGPTG